MNVPSAREILKLYKNLLRYGQELRLTDKEYFIKRTRREFKTNKQITDREDINFKFEVGAVMLSRVVFVSLDANCRYYSSLRKLINFSNVPILHENEIKEQYVKGSGPGGSKISTALTCVVLKHIPTEGHYFPLKNSSIVPYRLNLVIPGNSYYRFYSSIKKHIDYSKVPTLNKNELEEQYVKGSGPGGQKINKTSSCVVLKHVPTGLVVKCQETRSLEQNRKKARILLTTKLDNLLNAENSIEAQTKSLLEKKTAAYNQKKEKLRALKAAWKENENIT